VRLAAGSAAAVAIAIALALAGCGDRASGPGGTPAQGTGQPPPPTPEAELQALLDRRARALQAGDARRYAATATGAQRARDRRTGRNARGLPLRAVRLTADRIDVEGGRAVLAVRASYAVARVRGRFAAPRTLRATRTGRGWRIRSETSRRRRHPWEVAPFTARRSEHFTVLVPATLATDGLAGALEAGYARMRDVLSGRLRRRYLVVVAADASQARRMTAGIRGVATLAAISDTAVSQQGVAERVVAVASQRLLVVWPAFAALAADERERVVAHELTHAALARQTSGRTPAWLTEGVALYVSGDDRAAIAAELVRGGARGRAVTLTGLSRPDAIGRLGGDGQTAAYAYSSAAAFYIAERFGRRRFFALYHAFNDESLDGPAGAALAGRAVRRALGISLSALERDLRRRLVTS
jgi:hypothetical protein